MWLFPILLLAAVVLGIYLLVRQANLAQSRQGPPPGGGETRLPESAMEILKRRYAQGEISKEEFHEMKKDLAD
jgi:uncharacterized membrane protein